jgi:uncharacterized glyoxalase superfamily protein PhnB
LSEKLWNEWLYLGFSSIEEAQKAWDIAVENGAKIKMEFEPQEWGRQYGILADPFGVTWYYVLFVKGLT